MNQPPSGGAWQRRGGGAGRSGASPRRAVPAHPGRGRAPGCVRNRRGSHRERGSQTLEFALTIPAVVLLLVLVLHAGLLGVDLVAAQGMAREAARTAAVDDDAAVQSAARAAAGRRPVRVTLTPPGGTRRPGDVVTARLELASRGFAAFGVRVWVPARASMRVEDR